MIDDPEKSLCQSWSIGRLRPWLQVVARQELPHAVRDRVDPSDIVQMTLIRAWQGADKFKGTSTEERLAWLRAILKNTIRDQQKFHGRQRRNIRLEEKQVYDEEFRGTLEQRAFDSDESIDKRVVFAEESLQLAGALEQLPQDQRRVIELRHFEELSHAEIASRLGRTDSAVRMLWVRALRNLKKSVSE